MKNNFVRAFLLTLLTLLIVRVLSHYTWAQNLEASTFDLRQLFFAPPTKASDDIVMVWLDEATMQSLAYRSPIPRDFLAQLTEQITKAQPKVIGYDIFFKDPSFEDADRALAKSLSETNAYVVVPRRENGEVDTLLPLFENVVKGVGLADLPFNPFDAILREAQFSFHTQGGERSSFAAKLYEVATGNDALEMVSDLSLFPKFGPLQWTPLSDQKRTKVRFAGPPSTPGDAKNVFKVYSAKLVAMGLVPAAWLKDKIILIGAGYDDLKDAFLTPYYAKHTGYQRMNGVEYHANVLSSLLTKQFYYEAAPVHIYIFLALLAFLLLYASLSFQLWKTAFTGLLLVGSYIFLVIIAFRSRGILLPVISPLLCSVTSLGLGMSFRAMTEGKQKRWIRGVFSHYVPPQVVDQMMSNPDLVKLGGEERYVTSFFSDIASFTTISEKLDPTTLVKFLNEYLSRMNEILFRYGATIDKYEGDAIIAFFNAPLDIEAHENKAVRAALEIQTASKAMTNEWKEKTGRDIVTRIGLNTGPAVVGNMGSESRFDYTAIGDTINLASRLEGTNKFYGTRVMFSETTERALSSEIIRRPVDRVRVKGKTKPILLYEAMGMRDVAEKFGTAMRSYVDAFNSFEKRYLTQAETLIASVLQKFPDDGPSLDLKKRIDRAIAEPAWDLVTDLMSK